MLVAHALEIVVTRWPVPTIALAQDGAGQANPLFALATGAMTILGCYALWRGSSRVRQGYRMWTNEPVSAERARTADGVVSVSGTAKPLSGTITSRYTDTACLAHEWTKRKEDTRSGPNDDEHATMRTVDEGSESIPFRLEDDTGSIAVDPDGASLSLSADATDKGHDYRRTESRLEPGDAVHVYGQRRDVVENRDDLEGESVSVGDGEKVSGYRISDSSATGASLRVVAKGIATVLVGVLLTVGFGFGTMAVLGLV